MSGHVTSPPGRLVKAHIGENLNLIKIRSQPHDRRDGDSPVSRAKILNLLRREPETRGRRRVKIRRSFSSTEHEIRGPRSFAEEIVCFSVRN